MGSPDKGGLTVASSWKAQKRGFNGNCGNPSGSATVGGMGWQV